MNATEMSLRDRNLRFALMKAIADAINEELALERGDHTTDLRRRYDEDGVKSFDVKLPGGGKVATISLSIPKPTTEVVDEEAFLAWCQEHMPTAILEETIPAEPEQYIPATPERTVYRVDEAMTAAVLKGAKPVDAGGGLVVDEDGTVIEGVAYRPAGSPKSFSVRYETDGRDALAVAYRAGELDHLVQGSTLPTLEASHAIPMEAAAPERGDHSRCTPGRCEAPDFREHTWPNMADVQAAGGSAGELAGMLAAEEDPIVWGGDGA